MPIRRLAIVLGILIGVQVAAHALIGPTGVVRAVESVAGAVGIRYNTLLVLLGTSLLGAASGIIGSYAVLRRRSLVGDAVAHAALPGVAAAFLIIRERDFTWLLGGALAAGLLGSSCVSWLQRHTRIKADAAIGIVLSVFYGAGIALSGIAQNDPTGRQAGLDSFLLGKTAGMVSQDLVFIALVGANIVAITLLLYKEFKLLSFDSAFAAVQGFPVLALDALMMALLVAAVVIGLPAVGVVLMASLIILPGVSARFWTERLSYMLVLSAIFGLATGAAGTAASAHWSEFPAGAMIVLTGAAIFSVSMLFAPRRGVISRALSFASMRTRVARQNLLRTLYDLSDPDPVARPSIPLDRVSAARSWTASHVRRELANAARRGQVELSDGKVRLTGQGLSDAATVAKSRRLWELFLMRYADVAGDYADRDTTQLEQALPPALVAELETTLHAEGRWPAPAKAHGSAGAA
ncbi:MAG: metal ABC transporter permease [Deltaproteobacteria bacterium]|nr:metal ABC transporter permease [Deltaproteobacteria bacterium]